MRAKKTKCLQRVIALILVCASLLSHLTVGVSAEPTTEPTVYCGQTHEHTEACYVAPAEEPTETVEETVAEPVLSTYEKLMAAATVDEFYALLYDEGYIYDLETMTAAELAALDARAEQLYDPAQDDAELYEMIKDGIGSFSGEYEDNDVAVLVANPSDGMTLTENTTIGGQKLISGNTVTWVIPKGVTLTITGTVLLQKNTTLEIQGGGTVVKATESTLFDIEDTCTVHLNGITVDGKGETFDYPVIQTTADDKVSTIIIENTTFKNIHMDPNIGRGPITIFCNSSKKGSRTNLTIKNSVFEDCSAFTGAAVLFQDNVRANVSITGTIFHNNKTAQGGVIRTSGSSGVTLTLDQCVFSDNLAKDTQFASKKATYTNGAAIYWNACGEDLDGNTASVTITDCQFIGNTVEFSGSSLEDGHGGAIYNEAFMTFASNSTSGFTQEQQEPGSICGNLIKGNTATNYGGGIMVPTYSGGMAAHNGKGATLELDESVFIIGNSAKRGGGIAMSVGQGSVGGANQEFAEKVTYELTCAGATIQGNTASEMGGGVYLEREKDKDYYPSTVNLTAGTISGNTAPEGGAICVYNASETTSDHTNVVNIGSVIGALVIENNGPADEEAMAGSIGGAIYSHYGNVNMVSGALRGNNAENGGAIYVEGGDMAISGGLVSSNSATANGGGIYVSDGDVAISGGTVSSNSAAADGGGIYVNGGDIAISNGTVSGNTAAVNGGGIAVNNGQIIMSGGSVSDNEAQTGSGGGMYVSAPAGQSVTVKVFSGTLSGNTAAISGGAVGVNGLEDSEILVQIGVNENHFTGADGTLQHDFTHIEDGKEYKHAACPSFIENSAKVSGGAFYINAADDSTTRLNIYCSVDADNSVEQDIDPLQNNKQLSSYLMVQGGEVVISTSENNELEDDGYTDADDNEHGRMQVNGTIHVVGGQLTIYGSMENPAFEDYLTIDLKKEGDAFNDYRESSTMVKISYHENFKDADENPDSTQTAFDIESGAVHQIETGLYAHDGYELLGWNTKDDGSGTWYPAGVEFTFYNKNDGKTTDVEARIQSGDLTLYAIWKVNGYTITFDAGVAAGETWWGSVASISCNYVTKVKLPQNDPQNDQGFVYPGYVFAGWKLGETVYQPDDEVSMLTDKNADVVTFVAQWTVCEHPEGKCSYAVNSAGDTITKTCNTCQLSATAKMTTADAVYDTTSHPVMLECSNPSFWTPAVTYTATKIGKSESVTDPENCINAGNYTATITQGGETVTATFTIHKAEQSAPNEAPTYVRPTGKTDGEYQLVINQISEEKRSSDVPTQEGERKPFVEYIVRHYEGTDIVDAYHSGYEMPDKLIHTLTTALTTYSVHVRYEETDNYNASSEVSAKAAFYFANNFVLDITADPGISYSTNHTEAAAGANASLIITATLQDGYYLLNETAADGDPFDLALTGDSQYIQITRAVQGVSNKTQYTVVAKGLGSGNYQAHLHIGKTKKEASIQAIAKEKEHFNSFDGSSSVTIARDSAFTAQYTVTGYYTKDYNVPELTFNPALPDGTTIIMRDRSDGSYWYYICSGVPTAEVSVESFHKMGVAGDTQYTAADGDLTLQFVVDFSKADGAPAGNRLECKLRMDKPGDDAKSVSAVVDVHLSNVTYALEAESAKELEVSLTIDAAASKYDRRDLALVLKSTDDLPMDAQIDVKIGGFEASYRPKENGKVIIIPIGNAESMGKTVTLTLSSQMFPMGEKTYTLNAALYLSQSDAESAPLNGTVLASGVQVSFTSVRKETGIDVSTSDDRRIYTIGDKMTVSVATAATGYTIAVQLHEEQDGVYVNTALDYDAEDSSFVLNVKRKGNYCVVATLSNADGYVVAESRYYIIIKE